jgi:hypothetical protein
VVVPAFPKVVSVEGGGRCLLDTLVETWRSRMPHVPCTAVYGPSEELLHELKLQAKVGVTMTNIFTTPSSAWDAQDEDLRLFKNQFNARKVLLSMACDKLYNLQKTSSVVFVEGDLPRSIQAFVQGRACWGGVPFHREAYVRDMMRMLPWSLVPSGILIASEEAKCFSDAHPDGRKQCLLGLDHFSSSLEDIYRDVVAVQKAISFIRNDVL